MELDKKHTSLSDVLNDFMMGANEPSEAEPTATTKTPEKSEAMKEFNAKLNQLSGILNKKAENKLKLLKKLLAKLNDYEDAKTSLNEQITQFKGIRGIFHAKQKKELETKLQDLDELYKKLQSVAYRYNVKLEKTALEEKINDNQKFYRPLNMGMAMAQYSAAIRNFENKKINAATRDAEIKKAIVTLEEEINNYA